MINIYLCDDSNIILKKYGRFINQIAHEERMPVNIVEFNSGEQLLFHLEETSDYPDIIYLDILMGGDNGLETAKQLRNMGCSSEIIFLTSNPEYVFDSFDSSPTHYLIKDTVTDERFREVFLKTASAAQIKSSSFFSCSNNSSQMQIKVNDILYFEIRNRIVTVHFNQETFDFYSRLEDVEKQLAARSFIRIHRSYLVHTKYIRQISKNTAVLVNGEQLPIGITYAKQVKLAIVQHMTQEI